jgi:hypothetical protein
VLAAQVVPQALALDVRHGEPDAAPTLAPGVNLSRVVDGNDVGMLQPGAELDLAEEAIGPDGLGQLRMEHLQGDRTLVTEVMRQVDHGHPTAAELALDAVVDASAAWR